MATIEAIERRKFSRKARKQQTDEDRRAARMERRWRWIEESYKRIRDSENYHPIQNKTNVKYWLAKLAGWDLVDPGLAVDDRMVHVDPFDGACWLWWKDLHYETREQLIALSGHESVNGGGSVIEGEEKLKEQYGDRDPRRWAAMLTIKQAAEMFGIRKKGARQKIRAAMPDSAIREVAGRVRIEDWRAAQLLLVGGE